MQKLSYISAFNLHAKTGSAADHAYQQLRERIVFFNLKPDTVLVRKTLSDELGVSLTPLREALQRLESEELVVVIPQSKTFVTRIDSKKLGEAHFLRLSLESEVIRRITENHTSELISSLSRVIEQQRLLINSPERANEFHALDELFHFTMFAFVGQPDLHAMLISKLGNLARLRRLELPNSGKMQWVVDAHQAIVDGIQSGDIQRSLNLLRTDISASMSKLPLLESQHPDYFY